MPWSELEHMSAMTDRTRDALIGLTAILAMASMAAILMLFGELNLRSSWHLTILAPSAAGLGPGSVVSLNGVPVGSVDSIENIVDDQWQVRVNANINSDVLIADNVQAMVTSTLIGSSSGLYLETTPGATGMLPVDGTAQLSGPLQSLTMRDLGHAIDERLNPVLVSMSRLVGPWSAVGENLNDWLDDPELKTGAKDVLHLAVASLDRTVEAMERFAALSTSIDASATALSAEAMASARQLTELLTQTTAVLTTLRQGKGTAGQLLSNPDLYRSLESTAKELDRLTKSLRLLVEQVREEGLTPLLSP
jgi:ABC-type transporter Mla subunit MlaD